MHGKAAETAGRGAGRTATKEQMRVAMATQDAGDEDRFRVQKMIKEIVETTRCSLSEAELALHDASNNVEEAVNNILENSTLDTWTHYKKKGPKGKEEREEPPKKGGNRPARRGNQRDFQQKGGRTENGNEGPRNKEDGEFRGGRKQQERLRRDPAKREGKKQNVERKDEEDDHWKNGPLVFNRRDNVDEKESHAVEPTTIKPISQPTAAGPLSFADVVRKSAQKPQPPAPVVTESPFKLQVNDTKQIPQSPHSLGDGLQSDENAGFLAEVSKSPRRPSHHLDADGGLLHEETSISFGTQPSPQKLQQTLTAQLKNDLGLVDTSAFGASPSKKYHDSLHQNKASTVKAGVVEFFSSNAPAASTGDWQFGFEAAPPQQNTVADEHQFRREPPSKVNEPSRNEIGLGSSNLNEPNPSRNNASAVLNQYVQQQQQSSQPSYSHQPFNRNRNGANNLPFSNNNYSDNFNPPDLRPSYGASSPPKTQQPVQPLGSQQIQSQQSHHQHMFPPAQLPYPSYPYLNMYSPVTGLRDEFTPMLPFQNSLYQLNMDALTMMPQLANATSAGPLPSSHQHNQNSHPQQSSVQQSMQHQNSHSNQQNQRNEHYNENLFKQMNIPPASQQQNNGASSHNQQNSNLGNQQRQMVDNNSQGGSVAPPPGFGNLPTGPFLSQRNIFQSTFQPVPFTQFPYVMPKSK